ncbi:HupE/UreJ family protein [Tropicimonas isoalkanivorans]|uniref:Hydrogenase/urease accessory protein HupE n=1 Tax=Tropicimonas isoalkanivorans TaxID=441112 RepID=A0A1I1QTI6_9RHOB|nr:HupE/UreJ family protein [Tropicimonas isoalkanivorans]SFD25322.1 Hydrogenase/urease accessory protein HupE [Tropicimonas isoalkanivorans]
MKRLAALLLLLVALLQPGAAAAHALDPGYLELAPMGGDRWRVAWLVPDVSGRPMPISVSLPDGCDSTPPPEPVFDGRAWATAHVVTCAQGIAGGTIRIEGLEQTRTDTLVRYELAPGDARTERLTPGNPAFTVQADPGRGAILVSYIGLGISHILQGADHLLFVLALLLLIREPRRLLWTITAFTLAHSITLAAASLGWLEMPSAPVEVVIALSIVFLAFELALPPERRDPIAIRCPALVSFGFGLIHGLGFAGALREIGLPRGDIPLALFAFNVGVELGQLLFIGTVLALGALARRLLPFFARNATRLTRVASYGIGSVAAFWVIDRISGF